MKKAKIKTAIYAVGYTSMFFFSAATGVSLMKADPLFSGISTTLLQMTITLPALISIPVALFMDKVTTLISKKKLAVLSLILMIFGGTAPYFLSNYLAILFMRGLVGISIGITIPLAPSLVVDYFEGHERSLIMGFAQAATALGGVMTAYGAGYLASAGWRASYLVYLLAIPALILVILFLPDSGKVVRQSESVKISSMTSEAWFYCGIIFLSMVCAITFSTNISMLIKNEALGSPGDAGTALSLLTFGSFVLGIVFGALSGLMKKFTLATGIGFAGVGLLIIGLAQSIPVVMIGSLLVGMGTADVVAEGSIRLAASVSVSTGALAISLGMASMNLGQFISPFIMAPVSRFLGDGSERDRYIIAGIINIALTVFLCVKIINKAKKDDKCLTNTED